MQFFYLTAVMAAVISATPTPIAEAEIARVTPVAAYDTFDSVQTPSELVGTGNTATNGTYLLYKGFFLANSTDQIDSPKPDSLPNYIFGSAANNQMAFLPKDKTVAFFGLRFIYYACALKGVGIPYACTIQVTCYSEDYRGVTEKSVRTLEYTPPVGALRPAFERGYLGGYGCGAVFNATVAVIVPKNAASVVLPLFDSIEYSAAVEV